MPKQYLTYVSTLAAVLFITVAASAQQVAVESFTRDDSDQTARISNPRKDQNNRVCAILKIETSLLWQDFEFDAGSVGVIHSEQHIGEIWVYLPANALRISIIHRYLGAERNYDFSEALREATVYIVKLKSGSVKTVVEEDAALQYFEAICEVEGATISIDDGAPEPFINGKLEDKMLSYGKHRYTVEAPMYYPESGVAEITAQKAAPVTITLKPKFGKLTVNTQPEQGAEVFIDGEKRGQSPLTIERLGSGTHKISAIKPQFSPAAQEITITDGAAETLTLTMPPNFAVITLTVPGGDIYINNERKGAAPWSGRLTSGQYKVEVRKPSHRPSVTGVTSEAGNDKTVPLEAPAPIYGSLDIKKTNVKADVFIDGENRGATPIILNRILAGSHSVELRAAGYKPHRQTVEIQEGKTLPVSVALQEEEKTGSLAITANTVATVQVDGKYAGHTPTTVRNLPLGKKTVYFQADGYKPLTRTVTIEPGYNPEVHGELTEKTPPLGLRFTLEGLYLTAYGWGGTAVFGYRFSGDIVTLGAGGGYVRYAAENSSGAAIPVFADIRMSLLYTALTPYIALAGGVCFDTYANTDTYFETGRVTAKTSEHKATYEYYSVAAGLRLRCAPGFALHASAGYNNIVNSYSINAGFAVTF
jgi:hypothetical protein